MAERERINQLLPKFFRPEETPAQQIIGTAIVLLRMQRTREAQILIEATLPRVRLAKNPAMLYYLLYTKSLAHLDLDEFDAAGVALAEAGQLTARGAGTPSFNSSFELMRAQLAAARKDAVTAESHLAEALALSNYGASRSQRARFAPCLGPQE